MDLWTLDELLAAARLALEDGYAGPVDRRAGRLPNRRVFRFYAARGLLGPPAQMDGRVGLYSRRHLHTLVAIKRLQASGRSLDEIAATLREADDDALASLARPPSSRRLAQRRSQVSPTLDGLALGDGVALRFDPPLSGGRALERRLRRHSRAILRIVRAGRRHYDSNEKDSR